MARSPKLDTPTMSAETARTGTVLARIRLYLGVPGEKLLDCRYKLDSNNSIPSSNK
jgi:hypothetical protein